MISRTYKRFLLSSAVFIFGIIYIFYSFFYNPKVNIISNDLIEWEVGWENTRSLYSGSELGFRVDNSRSLTIEIITQSKADQGLEIIIDDKIYYLSSSLNTDSKSLTIDLNNKKAYTVNVRHSCIYLYDPCELAIKGIYIDKHASLLPFNSDKKTISILGDSLSTIYGSKNYSRLLADNLDYQLHNASILGSTVSTISGYDSAFNRYHKDLYSINSELIIIFLGTNDVSNNVPLDIFENNYSQIISDVKAWNPKGKILLVSIPFRKDIKSHVLEKYNEVIRKISIENGAYFVDTSYWLTKDDFADDIHPSEDSQTKISRNFKEIIDSMLKK